MKEDWHWGEVHRGTRIDNGEFVEGEYYYCEEDKCTYIISHKDETYGYAYKVYPDSVAKYAGYYHNGKRVFMDEEYKRREARREELNGKKAWLVYYTIDPFHGNYCSNYGGFAIAFGNTDEEIYQDWAKNHKALYADDIKVKYEFGHWYVNVGLYDSSYLYKCQLPEGSYEGWVQPINIKYFAEVHGETNEIKP